MTQLTENASFVGQGSDFHLCIECREKTSVDKKNGDFPLQASDHPSQAAELAATANYLHRFIYPFSKVQIFFECHSDVAVYALKYLS